MSFPDLKKDILDRGFDEIRTLHFKTAGGVKDAIGDYSVTATEFFIQPPSNEVWQLMAYGFEILGSNMRGQGYGNIVAGLTNGIKMQLIEGSTVLQDFFIADDPPKDNSDLIGQMFSDSTALGLWQNGPNSLLPRINLYEQGRHTNIDGIRGQRIAITLNDDFTSLDRHEFHAFIRIHNKSVLENL